MPEVSFLIMLKSEACSFIRIETLVQVFFCEFREIFKNTYCTDHLRWLHVNAFQCYAANTAE